MLCIVGVYRHIFGSFKICGMLLGLAGGILYTFNPLVDYANGYAWNHDVVILCVMLAFWLFVTTDFQRKSKYWKIACLGALLTFASCMRITTALIQLLFFAALLIQPAHSGKERFKTILPFLIVSILLLIWPIWVILQAPRAFFLNLYWIPKLYGKWLHEIGMFHNKIDLILNSVTTPGYLVLIIITVFLCIVIVWQRRKLDISDRLNLLLAALLPLTFFIIALIPPTIWLQYLAMPVPFLIIILAYPLFYFRNSQFGVQRLKFRICCVILAICVVVAVVSYPIVLYRAPIVLVPQGWTPIRLHAISKDIAEKTRSPKLILTLAPLFALEGGCEIYDELSAGAIVYRIADKLSDEERQLTHTVGPKTLNSLIEKSPPSAIILGVEENTYEETIIKLAIHPNQEKWERKDYSLSPPLSMLSVTLKPGQQLLSLYH
jgi:hypothetical protein